jgi:hypothetical protein
MRKASIAVLAVAATLVAAPSAGAHNMDFNTATGLANDVALGQCNGFADCIAYGAFPCRKVSKHKAICTIHVVRGTPGVQSSQVDCHRSLVMKLRRRSFRINAAFTSEFHCSGNVEHPGFRRAG